MNKTRILETSLLVLLFSFSQGCMSEADLVEEEGVTDVQENSSGSVREELLYVACVNVGGQDPDFLAVVGAEDDDQANFSKIIHRVDMPGIGDELHHFGYNSDRTKLLVPGLFSGRIHLVNVDDDPEQPYIESYHDNLVPDSNYIVPHTVIAMPDDSYLVTMIGSNTADTSPGGVVRLDANGEFVAPFGPPSNRGVTSAPPTYMYDIGINEDRNRMISTTFGLPGNVAPGITVSGLGNEVYVWDYQAEQVIQTVDLGPGTGALEVRWLSHGSSIGFTNAPGTSEIWRWDDEDNDGYYTFGVAISLPAGSIPTDMLLSEDDRFLYVANWMGNNVMQYDISDPFNPILTGQVTIPHAQMMRLSPDGKRLYVTNSLLSTWDDDPLTGQARNEDYGIFRVVINTKVGGMTLDNKFFVDLDNVQKKNTVGAARPHQIFFDPNVPAAFGHH
jgi:selenium-binding protein 1